ncbi:MAG: hypothetical protein JKY92_02105, partial [Magnetovibrio sp.]|nr:hypothetical protein [Magnetovibrio sp.]
MTVFNAKTSEKLHENNVLFVTDNDISKSFKISMKAALAKIAMGTCVSVLALTFALAPLHSNIDGISFGAYQAFADSDGGGDGGGDGGSDGGSDGGGGGGGGG